MDCPFLSNIDMNHAIDWDDIPCLWSIRQNAEAQPLESSPRTPKISELKTTKSDHAESAVEFGCGILC